MQIYAKAKSPSLTNKKHFGGNYTSVRSSGYGKVSSLKKDPLGASEKPTHLSPTKQAVPVKGFKTRSSPDHTKGRPKGNILFVSSRFENYRVFILKCSQPVRVFILFPPLILGVLPLLANPMFMVYTSYF